ncbi:MAG TPA: helix-turn-helix domain-containing protein [Tepidisphaeraceae bacterium]|nr:helix-turn-helix domain-containing protein [Tepidisphaeraceae bacterium]
MSLYATKKDVDHSPVRIRPPDDSGKTQESLSKNAWSEQLSVPPAEPTLPRWLSVEQVRKMQRMRRQTVIAAMRAGELPFEQRGRICYIRLSDVLAWEAKRLSRNAQPQRCLIHPDLADLA